MKLAKCTVLNCRNSIVKTREQDKNNIRYFILPERKDVRDKWIKASGKDKNSIPKRPRFCSEHFEENDYKLKDILLNIPFHKRRLKEDAVPSINLPIETKRTERDLRREVKIRKELVKEAIEDYERNETDINTEFELDNSSSCRNFDELAEIQNEQEILLDELESVKEDEQQEEFEKSDYDEENNQEDNFEENNSVEESLSSFKTLSYEIEENDFDSEIISKKYNEINLEDEESSDCLKLLQENFHKACGEIHILDKTLELPFLIIECKYCSKYFKSYENFICHLNNNHINCNVKEELKIETLENINQNLSTNIEVLEDEIHEVLEFLNNKTENFNSVESSHDFIDQTEESENTITNIIGNNQIISNLNSKNKKEVKFYCEICNKRFLSEKSLKTHEEGCRIIELYNSKVVEFDERNNHLKQSSDFNEDNDDDCILDENNKSNTIKKSEKNPHTCRYCNHKFKTRLKCVEHECTHNGIKLHYCEYCGKGFISKQYFKTHLDIHKGVKPNKCYICNKAFTRFSHLSAHIKRHLNFRNFKCNYCEKAFVEKSELNIHERTHTGEKPYLCYHCGKSFLILTLLKQHIEAVHSTNSEVFLCNECGKSFKTKIRLSCHLRLMHSHNMIECNQCSDLFTNKKHLKSHIYRKHCPNDLKYKCNQCNAAFKHYNSLWCHRMVHSRNKTYECKICSKSYTLYTSYYKHWRLCRQKNLKQNE